jgi:hypothetical protein
VVVRVDERAIFRGGKNSGVQKKKREFALPVSPHPQKPSFASSFTRSYAALRMMMQPMMQSDANGLLPEAKSFICVRVVVVVSISVKI